MVPSNSPYAGLWINTQGVVYKIYPEPWSDLAIWRTGVLPDDTDTNKLIAGLRLYGVEVRAYNDDWIDIPTAITNENGLEEQVPLATWTLPELEALEAAVISTASAYYQNTTLDTSNPEITEQYVFKNIMGLTQDQGADTLVTLTLWTNESKVA